MIIQKHKKRSMLKMIASTPDRGDFEQLPNSGWCTANFNNECRAALSLKKKLEQHEHKFETLAEAMKRQGRTIRALRHPKTLDIDSKLAKRLANKLEKCMKGYAEDGDECHSMACDICMMDMRLWHGVEARKVLKSHKKDQIKWVTIIPKRKRYSLGELAEFDCVKFIRNLARSFQRFVPEAVVIGGVDFSFNSRSDEVTGGYWQPHAHIIFAGIDDKGLLKEKLSPFYSKKQKKKLKNKSQKLFKSSSCRIDNCHSRYGLLTYVIKSTFSRKIGRGENRRRGKLTPEMRAELALYLDQLGYDDRMIFRHVAHRWDKLVLKKRKRVFHRPAKPTSLRPLFK